MIAMIGPGGAARLKPNSAPARKWGRETSKFTPVIIASHAGEPAR